MHIHTRVTDRRVKTVTETFILFTETDKPRIGFAAVVKNRFEVLFQQIATPRCHMEFEMFGRDHYFKTVACDKPANLAVGIMQYLFTSYLMYNHEAPMSFDSFLRVHGTVGGIRIRTAAGPEANLHTFDQDPNAAVEQMNRLRQDLQ